MKKSLTTENEGDDNKNFASHVVIYSGFISKKWRYGSSEETDTNVSIQDEQAAYLNALNGIWSNNNDFYKECLFTIDI